MRKITSQMRVVFSLGRYNHFLGRFGTKVFQNCVGAGKGFEYNETGGRATDEMST